MPVLKRRILNQRGDAVSTAHGENLTPPPGSIPGEQTESAFERFQSHFSDKLRGMKPIELALPDMHRMARRHALKDNFYLWNFIEYFEDFMKSSPDVAGYRYLATLATNSPELKRDLDDYIAVGGWMLENPQERLTLLFYRTGSGRGDYLVHCYRTAGETTRLFGELSVNSSSNSFSFERGVLLDESGADYSGAYFQEFMRWWLKEMRRENRALKKLKRKPWFSR